MMESITTTAVAEETKAEETKPAIRLRRLRPVRSLTPEQQERAESTLLLAYKIANRFARRYGLDRDDTSSVAVECLCRAAASYDPAGGAQFHTYAWTAVERAMIALQQREYRRRRVEGLCFVDISSPDEGGNGNYFDPVDTRSLLPEPPLCVLDLLQKVKKNLSSRLWYVLYFRHAEGQSLREIGESLGVSKERVRQLLQHALRRAREEIDRQALYPAPLSSDRQALYPAPLSRATAVENASAEETYTTDYCPRYLITCLLYTVSKPQSLEEITAVLSDQDPVNVKTTVEGLVRDGKIVEEDGRYRLA